MPGFGIWALCACLALFGMFYAATEGVLMAMVSAVIPPSSRTSGLAILVTLIAIGKMISSLLFGWIWDSHGAPMSVLTSGLMLVIAVSTVAFWLRGSRNA